jgi:hypothetical protein
VNGPRMTVSEAKAARARRDEREAELAGVDPGDQVVITGLPRQVVELVQQLGGDPGDLRLALLPSTGMLVIYRANGPSRDDQLAGIRADLAAVRELLDRHVEDPHPPQYAAGEGPV